MSRGPDAATLLRRALERSAQAASCPLTIITMEASRWASATFTGARHTLVFVASDDAALADWLAELPEADLPIRGQIVAEILIVSIERAGGHATVTAEALTVES